MRIVYLHQYFRRPTDNGSSRTYEMARRLAERGHDVHVVSSSSTAARAFSEPVANFTVHWLPVAYDNTMGIAERIRAFIRFALQSSWTGWLLKGDLVFATSTPLTIAIPGIVSSWRRNVPMVFEVRDLWPAVPIAMGALSAAWMRFLARALERLAYRSAAHIVALSPDMKSGISATGIDSERITVISNASDNDLFDGHEDEGRAWRRTLPWLFDRPLVLYCGTIGKVNDVGYLARVAAVVKNHDSAVRFVIIGTGGEKESVRREAVNLGVLNDNLYLLPPVPKSEVPALFSAADVTVSTVADIPELSANSANKIFDSFAAGKPVIINHGGWLADLLTETSAGLVLDPHDVEKAAASLLTLLHDSARLKASGQEARRLATERFDCQLLADKLASVLEHNSLTSHESNSLR